MGLTLGQTQGACRIFPSFLPLLIPPYRSACIGTGPGAILRFLPPLSSLDPHMVGDRSLTWNRSPEAVGEGVGRAGKHVIPPYHSHLPFSFPLHSWIQRGLMKPWT